VFRKKHSLQNHNGTLPLPIGDECIALYEIFLFTADPKIPNNSLTERE
jgi:hypothetical protein